jgi:hypothetical protein
MQDLSKPSQVQNACVRPRSKRLDRGEVTSAPAVEAYSEVLLAWAMLNDAILAIHLR